MADYSRELRRFFYTGLSLVPQDALGDGKAAYVRNIRSYQPGTWTVRNGSVADGGLAGPVHSLARLNDTTAYATGAPARRFAGAGNNLEASTPGSGVYGVVTGGFSGNPLNFVVAAPVNSPRPYLYVADSVRLRKVDSGLNDFPIGLTTPIPPPSALFAPIQTTDANFINDTSWVDYGVSTGTAIVDRLPVGPVTLTTVLYDSGTTGMATIEPTDMTGIVPGCVLTIVDLAERVIVQETHPSVGSTTIDAIQYDAGTTGLCTIQPTGSLYTGQIEAAVPDEVRRRYTELNKPVPPRVTVGRTVDFPVNSLVSLNALETVRILSVAVGTDGILSFRCFTTGTFAPGDAIDGVSCFRASTVGTATLGMTLDAKAVENTITCADAAVPEVGGVQAAAAGGLLNWGLVGAQATSGNDIIRLGFKASQFGYVQSVRLMLNLTDDDGAGGSTFLKNYFLYEWRASDLLAAVQIAVGQATGLMADAQAGAVQQGQTDASYSNQYGQEPTVGPGPGTQGPTSPVPDNRMFGRLGYTLTPSGLQDLRDRVDSFVQVGATASRQISLGDEQWVWLQCRIQDLTRIGTDTTKNLSTLNGLAMTVQIGGTTDPITVDFGDLYLTGGYGPDVGQTLTPYAYRYRYRSTITGERSNPSPPMRAGISPQRGRVLLTGAASGAPQCDAMDWFRYGGLLARWTYVGTSDNGVAFTDDMEDGQIDGGETLNNDLYQPWPTYDLPRSGTVAVAGTSITWVSGDPFNPLWGANSIVIVNGRATTFYQQPNSTTRAQLVDNCGSGTVPFQIPGADLLGQALPYFWGGALNGVWFNFACGDPSDPSLLHWTHGNDPDATQPSNTLVVSTASSPLMNGFFDDGVPYVFSSDQLYRIEPVFGAAATFVARATQCTKGLWSPWCFVVLPNGGGVIFLGKDGFYFAQGGGDAKPITDPDLKILFPQDGAAPPQAVRGIYPVDMTQTTRLHLSVIDKIVYFDYVDTQGNPGTLLCEPDQNFRWSFDRYDAFQVVCRLGEDGPQVHDHVIGTVNGTIYLSSSTYITDVGTPINWEYWTQWDSGQDPRATKQYGDSVLNFNAAGSQDGITVTPVIAHGNVALPSSVLGQGDTLRTTYIVENNAGNGGLSPNLGLQIQGTCQVCDVNRPIFYYWEPAWLFKQTIIHLRATDYENLGYVGAKFIQGVVLRANTYGQSKQVAVQYDAGLLGLTLDVNHNGDLQRAYPLSAAGWTPFIAELVRLKGQDTLDWNLLDWRWVWEPAPELATQWETQDTTFDLPGFLSVHDVVMAYSATAAVTLTVWHDANPVQYMLAATGGVYVRAYLILQAAKGKAARFRLTSDEPFRVFKRDCSMRVQGWGVPGGFMVANPYGGPSRVDGAGI